MVSDVTGILVSQVRLPTAVVHTACLFAQAQPTWMQ
jgi:hypothetical protein